MKKSRRTIVCALAVCVVFLICCASVQAIEFGVRGYWWLPEFSGDFSVDKDGVAGTNIDVESDLDIGDESYPSFEAFAGVGAHHISLMYTKADYTGRETLGRTVHFMGRQFTEGTAVRSDLQFTMLDIEYQYDIVDLENILAGLSVGIIGKVKYIDGQFRLKDTALGLDDEESFTAPIPMLGLALHAGILADILEARVRGTGIIYPNNTVYEWLAEVSYTPFPFLDIQGGYRVMKLDVDDISDVYADIVFRGPYIGLTISF
jgi:outer membrane protein